jgi:hypothetical protein
MPIRRLFLFALFVLLVPLFLKGCRVATDLGRTCQLVKRNPDGGQGSVAILESELPAGTKDFISFGATECEDLVCVRSADIAKTGVPGAAATGYCSRACVPNASTGCPAANSDDDKDPTRRLICRALLLDDLTLAQICTNDPGTCQQIGGARSPYFCAHAVDAGS